MANYKSLFLGLILLLGIVLVVYFSIDRSATPDNISTRLGTGVSGSYVELVEFGDFQCPACGIYHSLVKDILKEYGDKIRFSYRHFPLSQHKNADIAARSSEAAREQGKFWEMYDIIFENQSQWSDDNNVRDIFVSYAKTLSLDLDKFKKDLDRDDIKSRVRDDYQEGISLGINSTPTFFINGQKIQNPRNYEEFKNLLNGALNI